MLGRIYRFRYAELMGVGSYVLRFQDFNEVVLYVSVHAALPKIWKIGKSLTGSNESLCQLRDKYFQANLTNLNVTYLFSI